MSDAPRTARQYPILSAAHDVLHDVRKVQGDLLNMAEKAERIIRLAEEADPDTTDVDVAEGTLIQYADLLHSLANYVGAQGHTSTSEMLRLARNIDRDARKARDQARENHEQRFPTRQRAEDILEDEGWDSDFIDDALDSHANQYDLGPRDRYILDEVRVELRQMLAEDEKTYDRSLLDIEIDEKGNNDGS